MELSLLTEKMKLAHYNFVPDICPKEITLDMLLKEMTPDEPDAYTNTQTDRNILWSSYYDVCLMTGINGFYVDKLPFKTHLHMTL